MRTTALLAAVLFSSGAFAADPAIVVDAPAEPSPQRFGWDGVYFGASGGYAWLRDVDRQFNPPLEDQGEDWVFGGHIGYLFGFGNFVVGPEFEAMRLDIDYEVFNFITVDNSYAAKARFGYAWDRFLFTGHVGGVYATTNVGLEDWGWTLGAGIDYAITDRLTVGGQYSRHIFKNFDGTQIDADVDVLTARFGVKF
ncbi:MAG: outer membrane beta-barrel protein [Rhizobiaceae bacterium]